MKWGMHINGAWFLSASINYLKLYSWLFLYAPAQTTGRARHSELWNIYPPATFLRTWKQIILYNAYLAWQHCEEKKPWVMRICILNLHSHITASCCKLTNCRYHSPILYGCLQSLCRPLCPTLYKWAISLACHCQISLFIMCTTHFCWFLYSIWRPNVCLESLTQKSLSGVLSWVSHMEETILCSFKAKLP